ncbi:aldose epimerase family protein [Neolewinella agarilytica]|nr:aldose epimerase family protein [Neolewinella agarilytica]
MPTITSTAWGESPAGKVSLFELTNDQGNTLSLTNYGGIVTSIVMQGKEMVIGFDNLESYLGEHPYYGALVGRYGNRIGGSQFSLDGKTFMLEPNNNGNQLHGGPRGFNDHLWGVDTATTAEAAIVTLSHISPDGDQGFPGELRVSCRYEWTNDNELRLYYEARTNKPTIVNLTNHTYFNIGNEENILQQTLHLKADRFTPVNDEMIPFGENLSVRGTPFDFTTAKEIGRDIMADHPQIALANGYDHNFELNDYDGSLKEFALVTDPASGRKLRCFTTEPGVQIFTANFAAGQFKGRGGTDLPTYGAICLETQHFPDSPNQANFKTPRLDPGQVYSTTTVYRFE